MKKMLKWAGVLVMTIGCVALAAGASGYGGQVTREDLFKRFFSWDSSGNVTLQPGFVSSPITAFIANEMQVGQNNGIFFNSAGTHRIVDFGDVTGINVNTAFTAVNDITSSSGAVFTHGVNIHDTGIGFTGGLHLTQGDSATAFIPFERGTADNLAVQFGGGRTPDGATFSSWNANDTTTGTYVPEIQVIGNIVPASGTNGTFTTLELNPTINATATSGGKATVFAIASVTNTYTNGAILLFDYGTTTGTYGTGFTSKFKGDTSGNLTMTGKVAPTNGGTCTLNGATPSTCTVTVTAGAHCVCSPIGASAVTAAGGCSVGLSSTTLTVTGPAASAGGVNVWCDK